MSVAPRAVALEVSKVLVEPKEAVGGQVMAFPAETGPALPEIRQAVTVEMRLQETVATE